MVITNSKAIGDACYKKISSMICLDVQQVELASFCGPVGYL